MEKYLTTGEVAKILGVSTQTVRRWDKSGKFKSTRNPINNYRVYPTSQVDRFLQKINADRIGNQESAAKKEITPVFKTQLGTLYREDVVDLFRALPDNSVDLIFADPPYNIKKAEWDSFESQKQYISWSMKWITEAHRVLAPQGSLYICGFSEILADIKWAASELFTGCKWLVWFYRNKANLGKDWGRSHESLLHFRKSRKFIFNLDAVRIPYNEHTLKYPVRPQADTSQYAGKDKKEYVWTPHPGGAKPKDVFELPTLSNSAWEKTPHPTQKPVALLKKVILASSEKGNLIVDPFGGSGTTYIVAEAFERRWIGGEINSEYCEIIENRLKDKKGVARVQSGIDDKEGEKRREKIRGENKL